ncbi:MAG: long-chain fatty acid--CoA ligase [Proteobacteria bacterium]|nr:long-chain fatty acid--CoA ligase [Pseudomonadota bacterium]
MFFAQAHRRGDSPFLWAKRAGAYAPLSWREVAARVALAATALERLGVGAGDRVLVLSENRPEWLIADLAIMSLGAITVPAYVTNTPADHRHLLTDSGARGAVVSTPTLLERLLPAAAGAPGLDFMVAIEPPGRAAPPGLRLRRWDDLVAGGAESAAAAASIARRVEGLRRADTACLIYTSGTGGTPKGVMLSHGAMLSNCEGAIERLAGLGLDREVFLSFLPLSHSYEHTAGQFFPISIAAEIYYAEGIEHLSSNLVEARPTLMTAVPRLYETMHQRIRREVERAGGLKARLFEAALSLGRRAHEAPERLGRHERLIDRTLDRLVRERVRARFGGRLKAMISGGAPLAYEVGMFFVALGLTILQGYGQTESGPVVSCNAPEGNRLRTVGRPLPRVEVRIADDGEILVRGELVMQGYWNLPADTAEALHEGWLHTGDIGEIDAEGYLRITDRKKDIIKTSGGDTLSPQRIEAFLTAEPEIAQAMVYGDRRPYLVALVVPEAEFVAAWAESRNLPPDLALLAEERDFHAVLSRAVERANARLATVERVRHFAVAPAPFSIGNGQMTPTLKVRRHVVRAAYETYLERLYA